MVVHEIGGGFSLEPSTGKPRNALVQEARDEKLRGQEKRREERGGRPETVSEWQARVRAEAAQRKRQGPRTKPLRALRILQLNCCGIRARSLELRHGIDVYNPDVVMIQETWLDKSVDVRFPGYACLRRDRPQPAEASKGKDKKQWVKEAHGGAVINSGEPTRQQGGVRSTPDVTIAPRSYAASARWNVLEDWGADHLPLLTDVLLKEAPIKAPRRVARWAFRKADWGKYQDLTEKALRDFCSTEAKSVHELNEAFTQ
eukprot:gene5399-3727_t